MTCSRQRGGTGEPPHTEAEDKHITVLIADDHAIVRSALHVLLDAEEGFEVVAEASELTQAVRRVLGYKPDVLLLDLHMHDETTLPAIEQIREISPHTKVVVLTVDGEASLARQALKAGALGYVLKDAAEAELAEAIRQAVAGRAYLHPSIGAELALEPTAPAPPSRRLTQREVGVLRLIALGYTTQEIANQLHLSPRTVESHRGHIQKKLSRFTRSELVRYALDEGVIER